MSERKRKLMRELKDLDWKNLGFVYRPCDWRYVAEYKEGKWQEGHMSDDPEVRINECAGILQYCQECFEGLKAYETVNGDIVCFRPDLNAERMYNTAKYLCMPPFPKDKFLEVLEETVKANIGYVPPYGSGASLYIRPYMFASGPVIGVKPSDEYIFRMIVMPVGPYYKGGAKPVAIMVSDFDRAAPRGSGHVKAGLNYAMSMHAHEEAASRGYADNLFLDPAERKYVEESGGANFYFITEDKKTLVTPKSDSILPSITRRSIVYVAEHMLGLKVEERKVEFAELESFSECGMCGTAAVISPVGVINDHGRDIVFGKGLEEAGPVTKKLYDTLTGIQLGTVEAPEGWIYKIA